MDTEQLQARLEDARFKGELSAAKIDRLVAALRQAAMALRFYEQCKHGMANCTCTQVARAGVRTLELTGEVR